ncbi:hypothetical protein GE21DRAFT_1339976 [Neurospora crassa]|nr:hypothetical protein GE21DRAFT_1339976 [Neurospora crassa]
MTTTATKSNLDWMGGTELEVGRIDVSPPSQNLLRPEKEPREDKNLYNIQSRIPATNE